MQTNFAALLGNVEATLDQWCASDGANTGVSVGAHNLTYFILYV